MSSKEEREVELAEAAVRKVEDQLRQAKERLQRAKEALPNRRSPQERRRIANARNDIIWRRYLDGERDQTKLAAEFGLSRRFIHNFIDTRLRLRKFGPPTSEEHAQELRWRERWG